MKPTGSRWLALASSSAAALCVLACASFATIGGVLDEIVETGIFRLGLRDDVRPFAYVDADGAPAGFCVDMAKLLALKLAEYADRTIETHQPPIGVPRNGHACLTRKVLQGSGFRMTLF